MLVLSRQRDESIIFTVPPSNKPTEAIVTCVDLRGDKVRLGCTAPVEVSIHREEVQRTIERERAAMAGKVQTTP